MGNLVKETPYSEITATLEALDKCRVTREHLKELRKDKDYLWGLARFIRSGGIIESEDQQEARKILGEANFFGAPEWSKYLGVRFTNRELGKIVEFPWSEQILNSPCPFFKGKLVRETHFAYLGLTTLGDTHFPWGTLKSEPLTIKEWESHLSGVEIDCSYKLFRVGEHIYRDETCGFRWHLMPKRGVPNSEDRNLQDQQKMLPSQYEIPRAIEEATKHILYYKKNKEYINVLKNEYDSIAVRCRNIVVDESGRKPIGYVFFQHYRTHSYKGNCFSVGIADSLESLSLAASRKPGQ